MKSKQLTQIAMLSAVALIIFVVEAQIPLPINIHGIKLGLANVVTLFTLWQLGAKEAFFVLIVRVVMANLVVGNLYTMMYSLAGGLLCFFIMALMRPLFSLKQIWILSIFGAIGHNTGQLVLAYFILGTKGVFILAPPLLLSAVITGLFTGLVAKAVLEHMHKIKT